MEYNRAIKEKKFSYQPKGFVTNILKNISSIDHKKVCETHRQLSKTGMSSMGAAYFLLITDNLRTNKITEAHAVNEMSHITGSEESAKKLLKLTKFFKSA